MLNKHLYIKLLLQILTDILNIPCFTQVELASENILVTKKAV